MHNLYLYDWRKIWQELHVLHAGEIVDFDLLEIKQQIADAKNRIEVATVNDFVDHRPVVNKIESFNTPKPAVREVILPPTVSATNELDADDRDWDVPESVVAAQDTGTSGAAEAAAALVKGNRKK